MSTLHCALENGADLYVNERQKIRQYRARSAAERRRERRRKRRRKTRRTRNRRRRITRKRRRIKKKKKKRKKNVKSRFFTSRGAYVKLHYIAMLYTVTHSIGNQP